MIFPCAFQNIQENEYKRCKFNTCKFTHVAKDTDFETIKNNNIEKIPDKSINLDVKIKVVIERE